MNFDDACGHGRALLDMGFIVRVAASPAKPPVDVRSAGQLEVADLTVILDAPGQRVDRTMFGLLLDYADAHGLSDRLDLPGGGIRLTGP